MAIKPRLTIGLFVLCDEEVAKAERAAVLHAEELTEAGERALAQCTSDLRSTRKLVDGQVDSGVSSVE